MIPFVEPAKLGLCPNSKKIKKAPCQPQFKEYSSPQDDDEIAKKYNTYTKAQKILIIEGLWKSLPPHFTGKDNAADDLIRHLETISIEEYNTIIEGILAQHAPSCLEKKENRKKWQGNMKQWRRQLKTWIKNVDKPENRGNTRVVTHEKTDEFKQKLISILRNLTRRSFALLRKQVIRLLEEMHQKTNPDQPFNRKTFSKHFWYDFKKAHPEIEELYNRIPRIKAKPHDELNHETLLHNKCFDQNGEFGDDVMIDLSNFEGEMHFLSSPQSYEDKMDQSIEGQNQSNYLSSYLSDQSLSFKNLLENQNFITNLEDMENPEIYKVDLASTEEEDRAPQSLYCNKSKMIVEPEDNDRQRNLFRCFYYNGF